MKLRISLSEGITRVPLEPGERRASLLRFFRLAAVTYASFVVCQTVLLYALDWAL